MRRLFHACWPTVAVVALTALLALQIPRKALFFRAVAPRRTEPFASFVEFDGKTYANLMQKVRMSWQMRQGSAGRAEGLLVIPDLKDAPPPPAPLGLPGAFRANWRPAPSAPPRPTLAPPSLAAAELPAIVQDDEAAGEAARLRERLLALPASVAEEDAYDFPSKPEKGQEERSKK